jgi:phospholipid/cholesterol/gamma-HCH transport system substrate-binding protein
MENRSHALIAGIFTVLLTLGIIAAATWLNRDTAERISYTLVTNGSVAGLNPQAAVRYRGMEVGKVEAIEFDQAKPGQILVKIGVLPTTPVTTATYAELGMQGLTGLAFIQLDADPDAKDVKPLATTARLAIRPSLFDRLSASGEGFMVKASAAVTQVNKLLDDDKQRLLTDTLGALRGAAGKVDQLADEVQPAARNIAALANDGRKTLKGADQTVAAIGKLAQDANGKLEAVDRIASSAEQVGQASQVVEVTTVPRVNSLMDDAGRGARTFDRAFDKLSDEPTSLLFAPQPGQPGPGEPGFVAPKAAQAR